MNKNIFHPTPKTPMSILLTIISIVAAIIVLILIIALFTKNEYAIEQDETINQPSEKVFNYIKFLRNQDYYSKWVMMDPNARKGYTGTDGTAGFIAWWDSDDKNVGKGQQEIKKITDAKQMDLEIRFEKPFKSVAPAYIATDRISDSSTRVRWGFSGKMNYPMNAMLLFVNIPEMLKKDLKISLTNLKNILEKK
jgi:hypothetical protein